MSRKRSRPDMENGSEATSRDSSRPALLALPVDIQEQIWQHLDAVSLVQLELTARKFRGQGERTAKLLLHSRVSDTVFLSRKSWKERLLWDQAGVGFDRELLAEAGFVALAPRGRVQRVGLARMGPKLLVSDRSTADQPFLRWQLQVRGRNACVEFGVVPETHLREHASLHKALGSIGEHAVGFASHIVSGSKLPIKVAVLQNSVVEILCRRGRVEFSITNPPDCVKLSWENGVAKCTPYRGGDTLRLEHSFPSEEHVRLALTCWQNGSFEVLHSIGAEQLPQVLRPCPEGQPKQPPALVQAALRHMQPGLGLLPLPMVPLPVAPLSPSPQLPAAEWRIAAVQVHPGVQHPSPSACMVAQLQTMGMHSDGDTASSVAGSPTHPHLSNAISLAAEDAPDSARAPGLESGTSSCGESS